MNKAKFSTLHPGHVLERFGQKERKRVCKTSGSKCDFCNKLFNKKGEKAVRHEKGSLYLLWECVDCYVESLDK